MKEHTDLQQKLELIESVDRFFGSTIGQIVFAFVSICIVLPFAVAMYTSDWAIFAFFAVVLIIIALPICYSIYKKGILKEEKTRKLKIDFYHECVKHDMQSFKSRHQKEKAQLIAERMGCNFTDIETYFEEAKIMATAEDKRIAEESAAAEYKKLRENELDQKIALTRFADYQGRDKRIAALKYSKMQYLDKARKLSITAENAVRYSQYLHREINPGAAGGFASGLLGGTAGIAAYIDAENYNTKVRAAKDADMKLLAPGLLNTMNTVHECEAQAKNLQSFIDDAAIKLVSDVPDDKVFMYLSVSAKKVEISKTGAFAIVADVLVNAKKQKLMIGKSHGVIDGTIVAEMYQDGKMIGSALMMLPTFGVKDKATIGGISICNADASKPYKIKFKPYHLWIMEA